MAFQHQQSFLHRWFYHVPLAVLLLILPCSSSSSSSLPRVLALTTTTVDNTYKVAKNLEALLKRSRRSNQPESSLQEAAANRKASRGYRFLQSKIETSSNYDFRPCNTDIDVITKEDIKIIATTILNVFATEGGGEEEGGNTTDVSTSNGTSTTTEGGSSSSLLTILVPVLDQLAQYDVLVSKVCGSCERFADPAYRKEVLGWDMPSSLTTSQHSFDNYCGSTQYGYDSRHSTLVFLPLNPNQNTTTTTTSEVVLPQPLTNAQLRTFVAGRPTLLDPYEAPTERFPYNLTELLQSTDPEEVLLAALYRVDDLLPLLHAASGMISMVPDFMGYGESTTTGHHRAYITPLPYAQATAVGYLSAAEFLANRTTRSSTSGSSSSSSGDCPNDHHKSSLQPVATVYGYSEGAYGMVPGSLALQQSLGVSIAALHVGGTPIELDQQLGFLMDELSLGRGPRDLTPLFVFAYSVRYPHSTTTMTTTTTTTIRKMGSLCQEWHPIFLPT
jgi:hypothetical protein